MGTDKKVKLLYEGLTYKIIGALFEVYNRLGFGYQEKYYQRALAEELSRIGLEFEREHTRRIKYKGRIIGRYFHDFLVEDCVIVEVKVGIDIYQDNINQLLAYLKDSGRRIGILAVFTRDGVRYKRVIN